MGRFGLLAVLALGCIAGGLAPPLRGQGAAVVRCESHGFRDNYCPVDTRGGVRKVLQRSRTPCIEGETWGYDRRGIWVTGGCEADFQVDVGYRGSRTYGPGPHADGPRDDRPRDSRAGAYVVCESRDYRYMHCAAPVRRDVDLVRQLSRTECRYGRTWGYDRLGVWVDRGCAAEFVVY